MNNDRLKNYLQQAFEKADITLNGDAPHDIQIRDERAIQCIISNNSLGLGESYMEGWWDCEQLDALSYHLCRAAMDKEAGISLMDFLFNLSTRLFNFQNKQRAWQVAEKHYDLDNQLFQLMLDDTMAYSCGYWADATTLAEAQTAKYALICKKLHLTHQDILLDMGCGWGGLVAYAVEQYGCQAVGISIAENQISYAKARYGHLPIQFYKADYRDINRYNPGKISFTKLASVGAFEHIGYKNYAPFFSLMKQQLHPEGLFLLHTIGSNETVTTADRFIHKYIFPNGALPSMVQIAKSLESLFIVEDWHNFGADYDYTLLAWHQNFEKNWPLLKTRFDTRFYRMWRYYLLMCAGMFRARAAQLWQIVLSPDGMKGGYPRIR
jgi:cyclopropane-fatty-acyl-phospholipid synthase